MGRRKLILESLLDEENILRKLEENDIKTLHIGTLWRLLIPGLIKDESFSVKDFPSNSGLPGAMTKLLESEDTLVPVTSTLEERQDAKTTTKLLIKLQDGKMIEAVIIYGKGHNTLCVSSQVGCRMACTFCATGTLGLLGNLTAGEICEQLIFALRIAPIRNVVFMGMGEPLDNYKAVKSAVALMIDAHAFNLAPKYITISTVGVVPRMFQLTKDLPEVNLALSLHAPTQELRLKIVPTAKAYKVEKIMSALDNHLNNRKKARVLVECIVIKDINDSIEVAHQMGELLSATPNRIKKLIINLIPYNPTLVDADYEAPTPEDVKAFQDVLITEYGLHVRIRKEMGQENQAACGQLALKKGPCERGVKVTDDEKAMFDIEDLVASQSRKSKSTKSEALKSKPRKSKSTKLQNGKPQATTDSPKNIPENIYRWTITDFVFVVVFSLAILVGIYQYYVK